MKIGRYIFTEGEGVDFVIVDYDSPCGKIFRGIAIIVEPQSVNPVLKLLDEDTGRYTAGIGMNGVAKMLEYIELRSKELD